MFRLQLPRNVVRVVTAASAALILYLPTTVTPPAFAQDEQLQGSGTNRIGEQSPLRFSITSFTPHITALYSTLTVRVQVHNTSGADINSVTLHPQRAGAPASSANARTILTEPESVFDVAGTFSAPIELKTDERREVTLSVLISAPAPEGLDTTEAGTFPLFINANGQPADDVDRLLAETRALLPVVDPQAEGDEPEPPAGDETDNDETDNSDTPTRRNSAPFSLI